MKFDDLRLIEPLLRAVQTEGYTVPTPIQIQAIPHLLEGRDLVGCAQTGTGKTAAFALPILQKLFLERAQKETQAAPIGDAKADAPRAETPGDGHAHAHAGHETGHAHGQQPGGAAQETSVAQHASSHEAHGHEGAAATSHAGETASRAGRAHRGPKTRVAHAAPEHRPIRVLILTPTRELAAQIGDSFHAYGRYTRLRHTVIFGGVRQGPQVTALHQGVDILVATPGRLLDLMNQGHVRLAEVSTFVLDEADRMLDMGFIQDIRRVVAHLPKTRQTLLFSATMPDEIRSLASKLLHQPVSVKVEAQNIEADTVDQVLYHIDRFVKPALLVHLLKDPGMSRALVFCRTRHGADKLGHRLKIAGVSVAVIHADKSQNERVRTLAGFKKGAVRVLVASDIAARGLDVDEISHVVNYDLPQDSETYVHRIGRTGRAGASGKAISFCCYEQRQELRDIQKLLGKEIPVLPRPIEGPAEQDYYQSEDKSRGHSQSRRQNGNGQAAVKIDEPGAAPAKRPSWAGRRPRFRTRRIVK